MKKINTHPKPIEFFNVKGKVSLQVTVQDETVWLREQQLADLFERDRSVIARHLKNIFVEELNKDQVCAKFAHTAEDKKSYQVQYYNLDVIISLGYRVKSKRGILFRKWANEVLKKYLIDGYVLSQKRLESKGINCLRQAVDLMSKTLKTQHLISSPSGESIIDIVTSYAKTWDLLLRYDENRLGINIQDNEASFVLTVQEARQIILEFKGELMQQKAATLIFGNEKDHHFEGILASLEQTFEGGALYENSYQKAANLLYMIIKDHPFIDGNKRIASFLFILYLRKKSLKDIDPNTLTALTLLIAESHPSQKELMIQLILNLLVE